MKIIRINKGKVFNIPIRLVSVAVVGVVTIKLMDSLPEPLSIFISMGIATILPAIWFASNLLIIDHEKKEIFDGIWTIGLKFGKPTPYSGIEKIFINRVKTSQTMYSLSNQKNIVTDHEYRAYLKLDSGTKYYLISHPLEERVEEKVAEIKKKLGLN